MVQRRQGEVGVLPAPPHQARIPPQEEAVRVHQDQVPPRRQGLVATAGCRAFNPELRNVIWPSKFKPDLPLRYDGRADPVEFLQLYELRIEVASGDENIMANWFTMALKDGTCSWLLNRGVRLFLGGDARPLHRQLPGHSQPSAGHG